jgi:hypothetical protein
MALLFLLISGATEDDEHPMAEAKPGKNRRSTDQKDPSHASR